MLTNVEPWRSHKDAAEPQINLKLVQNVSLLMLQIMSCTAWWSPFAPADMSCLRVGLLLLMYTSALAETTNCLDAQPEQ